MTNFTLPLKDCQNIAAFINSFKITLNEQESLKSLRLCLGEDNLLISMANQYSSLEYNISIEYKEGEKVLFLDTDTFSKILNSTKYDIDFNIDFDRYEIKLKYGKSRTSIRFKDAIKNEFTDYYQPIISTEQTFLEVNSSELLQNIKEASIFKGGKGKVDKQVFLNIFLNVLQNKVDIVSSNSFCFYKNSIPLEDAIPKNVLITQRCLPSILNFLKLGEKVIIRITDSNLFLETENHKTCYEIADGEFPNYDRILPQQFDYQARINNKELVEAIRQALTLNEDIVNMKTLWTLDFASSILSVSHKDSKGQVSESNIDFEVISNNNEEPDSFGLNGSQVLDYTSIVKEEYIILNANRGKPIVLTDEKNAGKLCLIALLKNK